MSREDFEAFKRKRTSPAAANVRTVASGGDVGGDDGDDSSDSDDGDDGGDDGGDDDTVAGAEEIHVDVVGEMDRIRAEFRGVADEAELLYFHTMVRGGGWTFAATGHVADCIRGQARLQIARDWCSQYGFPQTSTFSFNRFGREAAGRLAREYCRRGNFFIALFFASGDPFFRYTLHHLDACGEDPAFVDFLAEWLHPHPIRTRADEISLFVPRTG